MLSLDVPFWAIPVWVCSAVVLVWAAVRAIRDEPVIFKQLIAGGVVEVLLLVQAVVGIVGVAGGRQLAEPATFWGYVVVALLLLPAGAVIAIVERTRWSSVALVIVLLALAAMELRMQDLWTMGAVA